MGTFSSIYTDGTSHVSSFITLKKGHIRLAVRGIKIPDGLAILECECTDTRPQKNQHHDAPSPHDLKLFVREEIQTYIDDNRIYTYAVREGLAMDPKELAIILLKFK